MKHTLPDGLNLYYELHGPADAAHTIVFLNGLSQSTLAWGGLLPLAARHRMVLIDLIFQGQSDTAPEFRTFDQHAADVADLLLKLSLPAITLVGISYGGAVAQRVLVQFPELAAKGILLSSFASKDAYFNAIGESWKSALRCGDYALMLDVMLPVVLGKSYFLKPLIPIELLKSSKAGQSPTTDSLLKLMQATEASGNYLPELEKVKVPVLVMHGEEDILSTPEMGRQISEAIPRGTFQVVPLTGHTLNLECIPQLLSSIGSFMES